MNSVRFKLDPFDKGSSQAQEQAIARIKLFNNNKNFHCDNPDCVDKETILLMTSTCEEGPITIKTICCEDFRKNLVKEGIIKE